jgi:hypothetical protein
VRPIDWTGSGPEFHLEWAGRRWTLKLDTHAPGVRFQDGRSALALLSLFGVAQTGRFDSEAFTEATLVGYERWRDRIQATFAPPGWGGLFVRAAWKPNAGGEAVDLEIQASASSVGELRNLELAILSQLEGPLGTQAIVPLSRVEARDGRSAALSYDGRESGVAFRDTRTAPPFGTPQLERRPQIFAPPDAGPGIFYVEMAQPNDVARRIFDQRVERGSASVQILSNRYALFGYDLEKGVVLRARLRGLWLRSQTPEADALSRYHEFLREPLPLGP